MVAVPSPLSVKLAQAGSPVAVRAGMVRSGSVAVTVSVNGVGFGDGLVGDRVDDRCPVGVGDGEREGCRRR